MQITFHKHTLRFKQPAGTSRGVYLTRKVWYVTARDGVGNWGIGECAPLPDLSCDALPDEEYERILRRVCDLVAEAEGNLSVVRQSPIDEDDTEKYLRDYPSMLFGIETALLSLEGCRCNANPYALFSNPFSRGEMGITINGLVWMGSYEEMMARMVEKLALGFRCIKIKIGAIDWEREISLIKALRQRFPREMVEIRVDANGGFAPEVAPARLAELARYGIHSIEQPIRQGQWHAMADLCASTPIPIALDEELIGINNPDDKRRLLDTIRPQFIILKPSLHGGLSGCEEWIRLAEERHISYWATSALESNVGLNAIAQWCGERTPRTTSGLGTGQLFVENYEAIRLNIEGEQLWCGKEADLAFQAELHEFLLNWNDSSSHITVHTSGSTGEPAPHKVEKERMVHSAEATLRFLDLHPGDSALLCMPLRYIAGKMMVVRALVGRLRLQLVPPSSHPLRSLASALPFSDVATLVPHFLAVTPHQALSTLEDEAERSLFERIPVVIIGGGAVTPQLHKALQSCQGRVYSTYGMTETLSHIAMRRLNGSEQSEWYTPLPGVRISQGEDGCLVIDAPGVCPTRLVTHDLCEIGSDGRFKIAGRVDNIISSGGIKLSLERLETKLEGIGTDFLLTSVPDVHLGEALTLLHTGGVPSPDALRSRLERFEIPRHILQAEALPLTETGKPARAAARQLAMHLLNDFASAK